MAGAAQVEEGAVETAAPPALPRWSAARVLQGVKASLKGAVRPIWVAILVLLVVWLTGRVMETLHASVVFDPALTYGLSLALVLLLLLWVVGAGLAAVEALRATRRNKRLAAAAWVFFAILVGTVLLGFNGYRTCAASLFAALGGSSEAYGQATFLLFKFHSLNPLQGMNLAAATVMGQDWGVEMLAPFVWSWNALFAFFIWSIAYGILMLMHKVKSGIKNMHLICAVFGLLGMIILKSLAEPTPQQMLVIQAAAAILLVFQVLLAYSVLRTVAAGTTEAKSPWPDHPARVRSMSGAQAPPAVPKPFAGLPPSALKLALTLFLIVPVLADLQNQFQAASASRRMAREVALAQGGSAPAFVAAAAISIRSGPAGGDQLLGVLPKGTRVEALEVRGGWVKIGENRWVAETFLSPLER